MPAARERALRALLSAYPRERLGGYGAAGGRMRVLRLELLATRA